MRARTYDNDPDRPDDGPVAAPLRFTVHDLPEADRARHREAMTTHRDRYLNDPDYRARMDAIDARQSALWERRNRERAEAFLKRWGIDP